MLINTFLDTEDFVHIYYPQDEPPPAPQGCGADVRMSNKYPREPSPPPYDKLTSSSSEMSERERPRAPPPPEPPPHRVRAADLYPRVRTHYDEPGEEVPFTPICAEFVQWVGRTADNCTLAMSNYRFHVQPRRRSGYGTSVPIRMIDAVEVRDIVHLVVLCKDGKTLKCTFNTGEQCLEWWRRLTTALTPSPTLADTFAAAYAAWAREMPPSSVHRSLVGGSTPSRPFWFGPEFERLGLGAATLGGAGGPAWRVSLANAEFALCPSYPPLLVVPAAVPDADLEAVARFRAMRRVPVVTWRHAGSGAVLARCSQPEVGWLGWRSTEDERLLAALHAHHKSSKLLIMDARSYASAVTNRARGGGVECAQYYPDAEIQFMSLSNIHHVRKSFQQLRQLLAEPPDHANWLCQLERTLWVQYVAALGAGALSAARALRRGRCVLVHCSDGWDRTPQLVAGAQLLLDPYYRSIEGFRVLVEREWLSFGHKFAARCGHALAGEEANERAPVFLQWLDLVHQIMLQYPTAFQFTEGYLLKLVTHVHSCMFGTFLCNSLRERAELRVAEVTADVWRLLDAPDYRNHLYQPMDHQELWPDLSVRALVPWWGLFLPEHRAQPPALPPALQPALTPAPDDAYLNNHNGFMTKTRSCDNLLNECEKRTLHRRCSDPSLAADVMKLSSILPSSSSSSSIGRAPRHMADLDVDLHRNSDHIDGLMSVNIDARSLSPGARDLVSNSSSLEREILASSRDACAARSAARCAAREAAREAARQRNVSITWRSLSDSSRHTDSEPDLAPHHNNNHILTDGDLANGSASGSITPALGDLQLTLSELPPHFNDITPNLDDMAPNLDDMTPNLADMTPNLGNMTPNLDDIAPVLSEDSAVLGVMPLALGEGSTTPHTTNGTDSSGTNGDIDVLTRQLRNNNIGGAESCSSGSSSSWSGDGAGGAERARRKLPARTGGRRPHCVSRSSTATMTSLRHAAACGCGAGRTRGAGSTGAGAGARCVCGGGRAAGAGGAPADGLPPHHDPLQAALHNIILSQRIVVSELSAELEATRAALRQRATPPPAPAPAPAPAPSAPRAPAPDRLSPPTNHAHASGGSVGNGNGAAGGGEWVAVGEEARERRWLPDEAAPRCQHCSHHFWLARRRHHCRKCGGIFCGSCSEVRWERDCGAAVRLCRRCRGHAHR